MYKMAFTNALCSGNGPLDSNILCWDRSCVAWRGGRLHNHYNSIKISETTELKDVGSEQKY